jgi:hypothetical protein
MPQPALPDDLFEHDEETFSLSAGLLTWQRLAADLSAFADTVGLECDVKRRRNWLRLRLDVTVRGSTASIVAFADYLPLRMREDRGDEPPLGSWAVPDLP